jgi:hypothetical protein
VPMVGVEGVSLSITASWSWFDLSVTTHLGTTRSGTIISSSSASSCNETMLVPVYSSVMSSLIPSVYQCNAMPERSGMPMLERV